MSRVIRIPNTIFERLQKLAIPFEDTPSDVIERLLDFHDSNSSLNTLSSSEISQPLTSQVDSEKNILNLAITKSSYNKAKSKNTYDLESRRPRQRGIVIEIRGKNNECEEIKGTSVSQLYLNVMKYLCESETQHMESLSPHIPYSTSAVRYLIAREPTHPNDKPFRQKVSYGGYFMEAHKDYKNAINHLKQFLDLSELELIIRDNP